MESIRWNKPPHFGFRSLRNVQFPHTVSCLLQELDYLAITHSLGLAWPWAGSLFTAPSVSPYRSWLVKRWWIG